MNNQNDEVLAPVRNRPMALATVMLSSFLYSVDWTIVAVALPHMQGAFSATPDQISWVITSYIVASAIMMPTSGWIASRIGRKRLLFICVLGFTVASLFCALANSLLFEVIARILQGMTGALILPLSNSLILDMYPKKDHGKAFGYWSAGAFSGAVVGPSLGGYLTEYIGWEYVFYLNIPFGLLALIGIYFYINETETDSEKKMDWYGFLLLATAVGSLQLMLDRGQRLDWLDSGEIIIELILFISCSIIFIFHIFVSSNPFLDPRLFINLRFFACLILASLYGLLTVPIMIIIPLFMESLLKYPIDTIGYLQLPRGIGIFLSLFVSGKLTDKYDSRFLIGFALICLGVSNYEMTQWNFETTRLSIIWTAFLQGVGAGIMIIPVQVLAFAMIKPKQRTEAASILQLGRSIFSSVGISITLLILFQSTSTSRGNLKNYISDFNITNQNLSNNTNIKEIYLPFIENELQAQTLMIGYINSFLFMAIISFVSILFLFLIRKN